MSNDKELYQFVKASERLPDIDNENPKHYLFLNEVNHHAIDIWTEFITNFPPLITTRLFDWKWLSPAPPSGEDAGKGIGDLKQDLFDFFLWFRENGDLYIDKSIENMISIYIKTIHTNV